MGERESAEGEVGRAEACGWCGRGEGDVMGVEGGWKDLIMQMCCRICHARSFVDHGSSWVGFWA